MFYRPELTKGGPHQNEFLTIFKYENESYKESGKSKWKNGVICLVSMFPSWVIVCTLSKKVHFLQFCADLSKKSKTVKAIYIYASESSHYILSENAVAYSDLSHCSWDISD